jgi:hypothetical protein
MITPRSLLSDGLDVALTAWRVTACNALMKAVANGAL